MPEPLYVEQQPARSGWIILLLLALSGLFLWGIVQQIFLGQPWGNNPASDTLLVLFGLIPVGLLLLFLNMRLDLRIDPYEIRFRLFPLQFKYRMVKIAEVEWARVVQYKPMRRFGGWGIRFGRNNSMAYTVSGNIGLEVHLKSGRNILIGTRQPHELTAVLDELGILKSEVRGQRSDRQV